MRVYQITLWWILKLASVASQGFSVIETHQPSAFSETIGEVKFVETYWKIVIPLDNTYYNTVDDRDADLMKSHIDEMKDKQKETRFFKINKL